ncbi:RNA-binding S4 domain-containing protein [Streptobacillus felis]|uniref:RQC P-site tRNA stabilizing factor n=1 Tax=Streptobacillus felis TaxID=1384509 RepID=A0A7Z0TAI4_9FUSO|nr:RNA-binding S4 domain-containing protein [Streptobacillus felis]NYV28040.1 RNA-binding S4 domain-containing protein [Streptobacillus felis]
MRLDKFLKVTRVVKRRTIANELCDSGNVKVNGDVKKALYSVKEGDKIDIKFYNRNFVVNVLKLPPESLRKEDIDSYITVEEIKNA